MGAGSSLCSGEQASWFFSALPLLLDANRTLVCGLFKGAVCQYGVDNRLNDEWSPGKVLEERLWGMRVSMHEFSWSE